MSDQVLGIRSAPEDEPDDLMAMFADDDTETEPGGEVVVAPAPSDDDLPPDLPLDEAEPSPGAPEPLPAGEGPFPWAGKYRTPDELAQGYGEVTTAFTRVTQQNAEMRQAIEDQQSQIASSQAQMGEIVQFLQAKAAEDDPDFAEELARRQQMDQMVSSRTQPLQEQLAQQQQQSAQRAQQEAYKAEARGAISGFFAAHPDITPDSDGDRAMTQTVQTLLQSGVALDIRSPEHLEVALEATRNPAFAVELMMSPQAMAVPGGVARIRERSGATMARATGPGRENPTRPAAPVRRQTGTFVETGSGGSPQDGAPGETPTDEFDQAFSYYKAHFEKGPLFGSSR
jgi:hypothetical protein